MPGNRSQILVCLSTILPALCLAGGCSDNPHTNGTKTDTNPKTTSSSTATIDPLVDAPVDWLPFLKWAEKKIEEPTANAPLPSDPRLSEAAYPLLHLADVALFESAEKRCDWKLTAPAENALLAELGPFRSDQPPTDQFKCQAAPKTAANSPDALLMAFSSFSVPCDEVGSIGLTMNIPYGKYVCLSWSSIGCAYIPVESHDESFTVRVPTDDFVDWSGTLSELFLQTDGAGPGVIEIKRLRFLPRELSYPRPIAARSVRLGEDIRTSIYAHCPAEIRYPNVTIPKNARLRAGLGCVSEQIGGANTGNPTTAVRFEIAVEDGQSKTILQRQIEPGAAWQDALVDLSPWSGQSVTIALRCASDDPDATALWAEPVIYEPTEEPELLIIYLIDTVAAEHVGLYGYDRDTMPRLTQVAGDGVWFANTFSNASRTIESIPNLMLSMPTERHGVYHNSTPAPEALVTLAEMLRAQGFATASFCTNVNAGFRQGMAQGFDTFIDKTYMDRKQVDRTVPLDECLAWLRTHRDRPMFMYIHTAEPHSPYTPPEEYAGRFDPDYRGRFDGVNFRTAKNPRDVTHIKALYDEELVYADARLGLFLDALKSENLLATANIFITSDHGEEFLEHNSWEHGRNLFNEQTRIPLVAFGPDITARGRVDTPVQLVDLMPTILEMRKLPVPYELSGDSIQSLLHGNTDATLANRRIFASNHNYRIDYKLLEYSMIADNQWKLVFGAAGTRFSRFMLFDVRQDPGERRDLLSVDPVGSRKLIEELLRWRLAQHAYEPGDRDATLIDSKATRDLEALGYLQQD